MKIRLPIFLLGLLALFVYPASAQQFTFKLEFHVSCAFVGLSSSDSICVAPGDSYPTTKVNANGHSLTYGWVADSTNCLGGPIGSDASASNDVRLASFLGASNNGGAGTTPNNHLCKISIDWVAGTWTINIAAIGNMQTTTFQNGSLTFQDNNSGSITVFGPNRYPSGFSNISAPFSSSTPAPPTVSRGEFMDAQGNVCTAAHWIAGTGQCNSPLVHTANGSLEVVLGRATPIFGTSSNLIANTGALTESGTTVTVPSTLFAGSCNAASVKVSGVTPSAYNGLWAVQSCSPTQFTYTNPTTGLGSSSVNGNSQLINAGDFGFSSVISFLSITPGGNTTPGVTPATPVVNAGATVHLTADRSVTWSCPGCSGSVDSSGNYTAPAATACTSFGSYQMFSCDHVYSQRIDSLPVNTNGQSNAVTNTCLGSTCTGGGAANTAVYTVASTAGMTGASVTTIGLTNGGTVFNVDSTAYTVFDATHFTVAITHADVATAADSGTALTGWRGYAGNAAESWQPLAPPNYVDSTTTPTTMRFSLSNSLTSDQTGVPWNEIQYPFGQRESGWLNTDGNVDHHKIEVNRTTGVVQETYQDLPVGSFTTCPSCNSETAARYSMNSYQLATNTATDAASLYLAPLSIHHQEFRNAIDSGSGVIQHAVRLTLSNGKICLCFIWPAENQSFAGGAGKIPYGSRWKLRSTFSLSGFTPAAQVLLRTMQQYGVVLADGGTNWAMSMDDDWYQVDELEALQNELNYGGSRPRGSDFIPVDESSLFVADDSGLTTNSTEKVVATSVATSGATTIPIMVKGVTIDVEKSKQTFIAGAPDKLLLAYVNGSSNTAVTWSMTPTLGTLASDGTYTPPATLANYARSTVTVTANADPTHARATIELEVLPSGQDIRILVGQQQRVPLQSLTINGSNIATAVIYPTDPNRTSTPWSYGANGQTIIIDGYTGADAFLNGTYVATTCCGSNTITFPITHATYTATAFNGFVTNQYTDTQGHTWAGGAGTNHNGHYDQAGSITGPCSPDTVPYRVPNVTQMDQRFDIWAPNATYFASLKQVAQVNIANFDQMNYEANGTTYYTARDVYTDAGGANKCTDYQLQSIPVTNNQLSIVARRGAVPGANSHEAGVSTLVISTQPWAGVVDPTRAVDWSQAGAGPIITSPVRTQCGSSIAPYTGTAGTINTAILACGSNQDVLLQPGTFNLSSMINFKFKNNVTLRGAGPDQTFIKFSAGGGCGGYNGANICLQATNAPDGTLSGHTTETAWTAGYTPGTTSITIGTPFTKGSIADLQVGSLIFLDQADDTAISTTDVVVCQFYSGSPICGTDTSNGTGSAGSGNGRRQIPASQEQPQIVTSISGSGPWTIGISPGVRMPNIVAGKNPTLWSGAGLPISGDGVENLSIDSTASSAFAAIQCKGCYQDWFSNLRFIYQGTSANGYYAIYSAQSKSLTVQNSYFFGTRATGNSNSYGLSNWGSGDNLFQNNITQHVLGPNMQEGCIGCVQAYNFSIDDFYTANGSANDWQQASSYHHGNGDAFVLIEGNQGIGLTGDDVHGSSNMWTAFRNYWHGRDPNGGSISPTGKDLQTTPIIINANNRFWNIVGNVLGTSGYHTANPYDCVAAATNDDCPRTAAQSIYVVGYGGNGGTHCTVGSCGVVLLNDVLTGTGLMRWGNYDTFHAANQFTNGEVPSTLALYLNPVPATQTIPSSFYLSGEPRAWWKTPWGIPSWPPIGPDVASGTIFGQNGLVGGHATDIPAARCWANTPIDTNYTGGAHPQVTVASISVSGNVATATLSSSLPSTPLPFNTSPFPIALSGVSLGGFNKNWIGKSVTDATHFTFTVADGLANTSLGTATINPILLFNANNCYQSDTPPNNFRGVPTKSVIISMSRNGI